MPRSASTPETIRPVEVLGDPAVVAQRPRRVPHDDERRVVINSVPMKYGVMDIGERVYRCFGLKWPYPDEKKYKKSEFIELMTACFKAVRVERFRWVDWIAYCRD